MNDFFSIQRIFANEHEKIKEAAKKYPSAFSDGVAVVTFNGVYYDDNIVSDFDNLKDFVGKMKESGITYQINVSKTIGHTDGHTSEYAEFPMEDAYGNRGESIYCPRNSDFKKKFEEIILKYATLLPTVLWLDDDFRLAFHKPVGYGCFCRDCIEEFNRKYGYSYDRDLLRKAILRNDCGVRMNWLNFNRDAMISLVEIARNTANKVDENIILGFMQVNPELVIYECPDFKKWIEKAKNKNGEVYFRHGSGFYDDFKPFEVVDKNISVARLCAMTEGEGVKNLTEEVTSPYIKRTKSMKITLMEALMNIGMAGADGLMDEGIKSNLTEQLKEGRLVSLMNEKAEYLNAAKRLIKGKVQRGAYPYFDKDFWVYNGTVDHMGKMGDLGSNRWKKLFYKGIPVTFRKESADVIILSSDVRAMGKEELSSWLSKGVYTDGAGAVLINEIMGENATGVSFKDISLSEFHSAGIGEKFTDHMLNGSYKGYKRSNYWGSNGFGNANVSENGCEILSISSSPEEAEMGIIGTAVYENDKGGRVAVLSRGAHSDDTLSDAKGHQIKNIFDYLSGGKMPVRAESLNRVGVSLWEDNKTGDRALFIYNTDFDNADIKIILDGRYNAEVLNEGGRFEPLCVGDEFTVENVEAFGVRVIKLTK